VGHLAELLDAAGTSDVRIAFLSSLLSRFPEGESLGAEGEAQELCTIKAIEVKDPLVEGVFSSLDRTESRTPPPLGFVLLLNLPKPCRALRPAFLILAATRNNSLSLEICRSSNSKWIFIFTIEKRSRIHQEKSILISRTMFLFDTCSGSERAMTSHVERHRKYYMGEGGGFPRVRVVVSLVSP